MILLLITSFISANSQANNPFLKLKFDKVVMYDFEGTKGYNLYIVNEKGQLATSITKQTQLDKEAIINLNAKLGNKKSYGCGTAACFDPHLGFVYYLNGKVIAQITICLDCNRLSSSIDIKAQKQCKTGSGKDVYYICDGMSRTFRLFLIGLLKKHNFSHQNSPGNCVS